MALLRKMTRDLRQPMGLRHPVVMYQTHLPTPYQSTLVTGSNLKVHSCDKDACTGWRRPIWCFISRVTFRIQATNYKAILRKWLIKIRHPMISLPPSIYFATLYLCMCSSLVSIDFHIDFNTMYLCMSSALVTMNCHVNFNTPYVCICSALVNIDFQVDSNVTYLCVCSFLLTVDFHVDIDVTYLCMY